ncbi:hypothetical protein [Burkholderia thailandensis]|uniref:hypothetical protein n=1 Tax=Burkholderia thailandensis TaxID=57975 RepID=UPI0023619C09|nr:hypothetical protein [Burkholderia thailandensis]MDD1494088.1 hypothetical protein [Burkholderia thailandensis]
MSTESRAPTWRSISFLPIMFELFGAQVREAQITYDKLMSCRPRPHVLDDATLARVRQVFTDQRDLLPVQRDQMQRWQREATTVEQREMLARLSARADRLSALHDQVLALVDELSLSTIDRLMDMSDADLAMGVLSGLFKLPGR